MIVAYNLFIQAVVTVGNDRLGGPFWVYHPLPYLTPPLLNPLVFLVWSTNCYQVADLGQTLPRVTFTNYYHRGQTTHNRTRHIGSGGWVGQSYNSR